MVWFVNSTTSLLCGANVVLADENEVPLNEETELLKKRLNVIAFAGDLTKTYVEYLVATAIDEFETVEILVNGYRQIGLSDAWIEKDNFQKLFDQILVSFRLSQVVAKKMINQKSMEDNNRDTGSIINLSSIADNWFYLKALHTQFCSFCQSTYKVTSCYLADKGIRVNAIAMEALVLQKNDKEDLTHDQVKEATH